VPLASSTPDPIAVSEVGAVILGAIIARPML